MKKRCLTLCLTILAVIFCTFGFTACKDENEKYYGVYKDQSTTFEIKKDCVEINGEKRTYTIDGNTLSIEGYTGDMHFYEHGKVLSFDVIVEFDSGSITKRNENFNANLWNWDAGYGGIGEAYTFDLNGKVTYVNTNNPIQNASGVYRIKNGVIQISTVSVLGKADTMYWYISEQGELHFTGVYIKDLDTYFNADNTSDNDDDDFENDDNTVDTYTITYHLNGGSLTNAKNSFTINDLPYELPYAQGTDTQSFVKWTTDEAGKNEIKTITELGNYTLYAHYEDSAKCLTYKYSEELQGYEVSGYTGNAKEVKIPSTYKGVTVKGIGASAFSDCTSLTSIEIPDSVTSIGSYAFSNCGSLTSIEIPDSVTSIGYGAFYDCNRLTSIEIPDGVTSIGEDMFSGCSSLKNIKISEGVIGLSLSAFENCVLETVIIDSSYVANVSFIGDIITYATDVYIRADITVTASIYNVLYNNLGKEMIDGVEYYHYQIKGE